MVDRAKEGRLIAHRSHHQPLRAEARGIFADLATESGRELDDQAFGRAFVSREPFSIFTNVYACTGDPVGERELSRAAPDLVGEMNLAHRAPR
jgi:hypothetical protein